MKYALFLNTESDSTSAERLMDYLQGRLRKIADMRNITNILAEDLDFKQELRHCDCVLLIGSRQASSLIQGRQQERQGEFITFDGKFIHDELTGNKELVKERLIIVHFTERTKNDWIPTGFDDKRISHVEDGKVPPNGTPTLVHLEYRMKKILLGDDFSFWAEGIESKGGRSIHGER